MTMLYQKHTRRAFHIVVCALLLCIIGYIYSERKPDTKDDGRLVNKHLPVETGLAHLVLPSTNKGNGSLACECEKDPHVLHRKNNSIWMNKKQQQIGQNRCKSYDENKTKRERTSETGGWCPVATETKHFGFDGKLVTTLAKVFKGRTVGSFGDGPGKYKKYILDSGLVEVYDAYDGAPFCETTSNGSVKFLDLSIPQYGLPVYDWILSLEVAEHIPRQFEAIFLSNLIRHAREGVILSWAIPGQAGYSHVNNRKAQHVIDSMNKLGFEMDLKRTNTVKHGATLSHLRRNTNVYIRKLENSFCNLICDA